MMTSSSPTGTTTTREPERSGTRRMYVSKRKTGIRRCADSGRAKILEARLLRGRGVADDTVAG